MDVCSGQLESPRVLVAARFPLDMRFKKPRQDWSGAVFPFILRHFPSSAEIRDSWIFHTIATRLLSEQTTWRSRFFLSSTRRLSVFQINFYLHEFVQCGEYFLQRTSSRHMIIIYIINNKINDEPSLFLKNKCYRDPFTTRTLKC